MSRALKWRGLGPSEYVSDGGTFLVALAGRDWHLYKRVEAPGAGAPLEGPAWTWSPSIRASRRKGDCQDHAERNPPVRTARAPQAAEESRGVRGGITSRVASQEHHNARCHECGVPFERTEAHKFGDLCGMNCLETMVEIAQEAGAA